MSSAEELDLDKSWDFVHFVFTGRTSEDEEETSAPHRLGFIGDERLGRLFHADDVRTLCDALGELDDETIAQRLGSREITRCYPCNEAVPRLDDTDVESIRGFASRVRTFVQACSAAHDALVVETY